MPRQYMNIRLSYEAKFCIEKIQSLVQIKLNEQISQNELDEIEVIIKDYLRTREPILSNVSITQVLKVSTSSIIEEACNSTQDFTLKEWLEIAKELEKQKFDADKDVGSLTPKLYLEDNVIQRLKQYQKDFMLPNMVRVAKLSYVIKLVVFAYAKQIGVLR